MALPKKFKKYRLGYMGTGNNVPLTFEMLKSDAWNALKSTQRDVLIDWYQGYVRLSRWDYEPLEEGMTYTYAQCKVTIREATFLAAIKRILEVGFFVRAIHLESGRPGSPRKFLPSKKWLDFRFSDKEKAKRKAYADAKERRLDEKRKRRESFRSSLPEKKEPPISVPTRPTESVPIRKGGTPKKCADTLQESSNSHHQEACRSYRLTYGSTDSDVPTTERAESAQDVAGVLAQGPGQAD
ncbi:MAG: hypothetical protein IT364_00220 [Candidatus Hydrogenedentes bacterium]|nr:hypothetical protein [Candidatus Hydrogenedentota bacterium]